MSEVETTNDGKPQPRIGSYQLIHPLGAGGMSSVFKAVHVETGHEVAVKVLPRALAKNSTLLQRFIREAKSAESLEHPNIVSIYDRGVDQGRHYLVLEYVEGGDLHDRVRQGGPLEIGEAIAAIRSIATGLQFAASRGLIHRDIKPANLLMTPTKQVKIIDLGLALQAESEDERVTREGTTVGTVDYMSPEQARDSRATNERSDIYSLGCTFYFLLTGSPPFPGGDISDKLSRHCLEAVPDSRKLRPEIPVALSILIRRMMAKRPENRFANYQDLIDELDRLTIGDARPPQDEGAGEPLFALLDEEEEARPAPAVLDLEPSAEPLFALIDEGEEEPTELPAGMIELLEPEPERPYAKSREREAPSMRVEVSLAELASLDDETPDVAPARKPTRIAPRDYSGERNLLANALVEEAQDEELDQASTLGGTRKYDDPVRKLVLTYSLIGLGLVVFIIGVHQLYLASWSSPVALAGGEEIHDEPLGPAVVAPTIGVSTPPSPSPTSGVGRPHVPETASPHAEKTVPQPSPVLSWVEPKDPIPRVLPEAAFGSELEQRFVPPWARSAVPTRVGEHYLTVRRVVDPKDPAQKHALRSALDVIGGTIELVDDGPFFEDDLRISGESRLIRAREGYRPIICVGPPQLDVVREQPAVVVLDGKNLTLDGLDLVVNAAQLPQNQGALFLCRGGSLTLRRCTITILNPRRRPFALVRVLDSPRQSRVRLEETLVRGTAYAALDLAGGSTDVVFNRSVVVSGGAPLIQASSSETGSDRTVQLVRSLLCGRGALVDLDSGGGPDRSEPLVVRALGSTFAQLAGEGTTSLIVSALEEGRPDEQVEWVGDHNVFEGWHDWFSFHGGRAVALPDLNSARTVWPEIGSRNREDPSRWRVMGDLERVKPADLLEFAPECGGTLTRVVAPSPLLLQKTVDVFSVGPIPRLASRAQGSLAPGVEPSRPPAESPGSAAAEPAAAERTVTFDLAASPWQGDLGLFVREQLRKEDRHLRVLIGGSGAFYSTPISLPEGVSLELEPSPSRPPDAPPIIWSAIKESTSEALIEVRGADLILTNVRLTRDGGTRLKHLIRVDGGHLVLNRCWLTAPGVVERGGGNLVSFRATSTQPRPPTQGRVPFQTPVDRPVCLMSDTLLITGGDAIQADVGRGLVALTNCALAVGKSAFDLRPAQVARDRFDAALRIERCTVAAEGSFVNLGTWRGSAPGPDRPWLVATKDSAFVASYDRSGVSTESVLLRVEADSLDLGALAWQSANDAFDVTHFTARTGLPLATPRRPEVHRQWVKLWGEARMHHVTGPIWPRGSVLSSPSVKFYERLQSGRVGPADLELDPGYHPGRSRLSVGADLRRLQVSLRNHSKR